MDSLGLIWAGHVFNCGFKLFESFDVKHLLYTPALTNYEATLENCKVALTHSLTNRDESTNEITESIKRKSVK